MPTPPRRPHPSYAACVLALVAALPGAASGPPPICEPQWDPAIAIPGGAMAFSLEVFDDGGGEALFAGASSSLGGLLLKRVGDGWEVVPGAPTGNDIRSLRVFDAGGGPSLYVAGEIAFAGGLPIGNIARWNGLEWSQVGAGINGFGLAMAVFDDGSGSALYVGGTFTAAGGVPASRIARWDGAAWSDVGGGTNGAVNALAVFDDGTGPALVAAGNFTTAGGAPANRVARWNGTAWSSFGAGLPQQVKSVAVHDDGSGPALHAAGFVTAQGGFPFVVSRWDGSTWTSVGTAATSGFNGTLQVLHSFDDGTGAGPALYAGGDFGAITGSDGGPAGRIAKWDGASWSALDAGVNSGVMALIRFDDGSTPALIVGGGFSTVDGAQAKAVARWTGCPPSPLGDLDGSGTVDAADLGMLLAAWGEAGGPADLDASGGVDGTDLGMLLAGWTG